MDIERHLARTDRERDLRAGDPQEILRRGYSITHINRRILRDAETIRPGAHIQTMLYRGTVESIVHMSSAAANHVKEEDNGKGQ